jgi:hypothetical protein
MLLFLLLSSLAHLGLAEGALELLLEPVVDALRVELVRAVRESLYHLASLECIDADCAVRGVSITRST